MTLYKLFVYDEGFEIGSETVAEEDLYALKRYLEERGFGVEVEKLDDAA